MRRGPLVRQAAEKRLAMRLQFSIRWIFAVTAIVGVALAALSAEPRWISGLLIQLIFMGMPGVVAIPLVAGRGYARAFAIGAVVPTLIGVAVAGRFIVAGNVWVRSGMSGHWEVAELAKFHFGQHADLIRFFAIFIWSAILVGGTAAVVIRWLVGTVDEK
jgi:hypothetical protein